MTPRLSVLMTIYNPGRYLAAAVDSVLAQTFPDFELVAVENGSRDGAKQCMHSYAKRDARIRLIDLPENIGRTPALNLALQEARGELVAVHDADDAAAPSRFASQIEYFDARGETVLLGSHYRLIDEHGQVTGVERPPCDPHALYDALAYTNPFAHSTTMFRRNKALSVGGYPAEFRFAQDYALWLLLARIGPLGMLGEALVDLRRHPQQLTASPDYAYVRHRESITLFERAQRLPALSPHAMQENRKMRANYRYQYARALIGGRRYRGAAIEFARGLAAAPVYFASKALSKMGRSLRASQDSLR